MERIFLQFLLIIIILITEKGMAAASSPSDSTIFVAVLLFPGVELQDVGAAIDVFIETNKIDHRYSIYTISVSDGQIKSEHGIVSMVPSYSAWDDPEIDVLVVPGGEMPALDSLLLAPHYSAVVDGMIRKATYVLGLGTGSFLIARTGRLDSLRATTSNLAALDFRRRFPQVDLVQGVRLVQAGHIITTAGLTACVDGALLVVRELQGEEIEQRVSERVYINDSEKYKWPEKK